MSAATVITDGREHLTGTRRITRFTLRQDRVRIPIWAVSIAGLIGYFSAALPIAYPDQESLQGRAAIMMEPSGALLAGPGYGLDDYTFGAMLTNEILGWLAIASALMSIFLVVRHTRTEEETGRAELIRAGVVGRHAHLTASILNVIATNAVVTLLLFLAVASGDFAVPDALAFALGVGLVGLVFGAVAAVTAQVTEHSRTAVGMAGAVLGLVYVLRGIGDAQERGGTWLSWLSPIGWAQQTRAFTDLRWWPLLLNLALASVLVVVAYLLSGRRDLGAGLVAARGGRADAAPGLLSSFGLNLRLERGSLIGWSVGLFFTGILTGAMGEGIVESFRDQPQLAQVFGVEDMDAFATGEVLRLSMSRMLVFFAMAVGVYAVIAVNRQHREESEGRTGTVLGSAISRYRWFGEALLVTAISSTILLLLSGLSFGLGIAGSTGETSVVWDFTLAVLVYLPVVLGFAGLAAVAYGLARGGVWWVWTLLVGSIILGMYGPLFNLPDAVAENLPFELVPALPGAAFDTLPVVAVSVVALGLLAGGTALFRRRGLEA